VETDARAGKGLREADVTTNPRVTNAKDDLSNMNGFSCRISGSTS
jgi:hypothetical protein